MDKVFKIEEYLSSLRFETDKIIEKYLPRKASKKWAEKTFGVKNLSLNVIQKTILRPVWNFLDRGGKRWRPALFLLIAEALGGDIEKIKVFSIIPEIIHNGTLCIDDIEDDGELRRGEPCLHKIFGKDVALNVGNFLYFFPLLLLKENKKKIKKDILIKIYEIYIQEMIRLHIGQGTDIFWHKGKEKNIREKEYIQMCAFKTGCLSRMAAKMAAVLSGGKENLIEKIGEIAENIGIAFQIQDDILDIDLNGKERKAFGKSFGNDIKEGKRTLMIIYVLKKAKEHDKKRLIKILNKHTDDPNEIKEAIRIIKKYGAIKYARKLSKRIVKKSWQKSEKLLPESSARMKLKELIDYLIIRKI